MSIIKNRQLLSELDLSAEEVELLALLEANARVFAPVFSDEALSRLQTTLHINNIQPRWATATKTNLQKWFMLLFQNGGISGQASVGIELPILYLVGLLDLFLKYGWEVTRYSTFPDSAQHAYYKSLARSIALSEIDYYDHMLEMMLLDTADLR